MTLSKILAAGLLAQGFIETDARGSWRRFAKFGRAGMEGEAYYTMLDGTLWFSAIRFTEPDHEIIGPILDRIFDAGMLAEEQPRQQRKAEALDADAALDELTGGSSR